MEKNSIEALYQHFQKSKSVCTDTRTLQAGDIFFALEGDNFDGNAYAKTALEHGASLCVVDNPENAADDTSYFLVNDVLTTLQQLARFHRQQLEIPVLAITGSNGKTTTKELVHAVLSTKLKTYTTKGNLNNHIGIPLTLLAIKHDAEVAVVEMGANHQREIASYCEYTLPTHGMITNCGKAHLEGFGGLAGVRKGKGELFDYLRATNGTAFVYADTDYFDDMAKGIDNIVWYGEKTKGISGTLHLADPFLCVKVQFGHAAPILINTQLVGAYNLSNVLAACTVGQYFQISPEEIKCAIEAYTPTNIRSQQVKKGSNIFIMDAYNANPSSMAEAIRNIASMQHPKKILLLGGMKEMGEAAVQEHLALVKLIDEYHWHQVVLVGKEFEQVPHSYQCFENATAAKDWWQKNEPTDALILVKGSRSIQMEKVVA